MKPAKPLHATKADTPQAVEDFLTALDHPLKAEILRVRATLLAADATVQEGVKWNAPSFRTTEYFATMHLRSRDSVQLVFHTGAKVRAGAGAVTIADPAKLARWLAKDRCLVTLGRSAALEANLGAFSDFVRAWIRYV